MKLLEDSRRLALSSHRSVFEVFGKEGSMRAEDLAMRALRNFSENDKDESKKEEENGDPVVCREQPDE